MGVGVVVITAVVTVIVAVVVAFCPFIYPVH